MRSLCPSWRDRLHQIDPMIKRWYERLGQVGKLNKVARRRANFFTWPARSFSLVSHSIQPMVPTQSNLRAALTPATKLYSTLCCARNNTVVSGYPLQASLLRSDKLDKTGSGDTYGILDCPERINQRCSLDRAAETVPICCFRWTCIPLLPFVPTSAATRYCIPSQCGMHPLPTASQGHARANLIGGASTSARRPVQTFVS